MRFRTIGALTAASALIVSVPATAMAQDSTTTRETPSSSSNVAYKGIAFGTQVSGLDDAVTSGRTASSSISCTTEGGQNVTRDVAGADLGEVGTVGAVNTSARTSEGSGTQQMSTQSKTAGINLLGGRITADAVQVDATAKARGGSYDSANNARLVGLTVGDTKIPVDVKKNTKVTVPGVAEVTLNQQTAGKNTDGRYVSRTRGIVVRLLPDNPLGLPTDTRVVVGAAHSTVDPVQGEALHGGSGFSTRVTALDGRVTSSPTALAGVPCTGGTSTNNVAEGDLSLLARTNTTSTRSTGGSSDGRTWSRVTNRTGSPRILGGLISADAIVADTAVSRKGGSTTHADRSTLADLRVAGRKVASADLAPNSTIEIPGIAKVTVHKQSKTEDTLRVTMLHVELLAPRGDLPKGAVIEVGHSHSQLR